MNDLSHAVQSLQEFLNLKSLGPLLVLIFIAFIFGRIIGFFLRLLSRWARRSADASKDVKMARTMRHVETWLVLFIAVVQVLLLVLAFYFWWDLTTDEGNKSGVLIGASAIVAILIGGIAGPILRDVAFGASMMTERWYGVGDMVSLDFPKVKGVVEEVTLRSTRIKGINGETYWIANSAIQAVSVAHRGLLWVAIEMFANDIKKAEKLIEDTNNVLPTGSSLVAERLSITRAEERAQNVWHVTAVAGVAPGREWIIEESAIDTLKKLDEKNKKPVMLTEPVHHYDDREAEKQIVRAVKNARKPRRKFDYKKITHGQIMARTKKDNPSKSK